MILIDEKKLILYYNDFVLSRLPALLARFDEIRDGGTLLPTAHTGDGEFEIMSAFRLP